MAETQRDRLMGMLQEEFPDYHPILSIARIAHDENASLNTQVDCHKTVLKYTESELKSIEVKADQGSDFGTLRVIMESAPTDIPTELPADLDDEVDGASSTGNGATNA